MRLVFGAVPDVWVLLCGSCCRPSGVQAKLQKAQQQREYAKAFHADVLKKMAAEGVAQQVGVGACTWLCGTPCGNCVA